MNRKLKAFKTSLENIKPPLNNPRSGLQNVAPVQIRSSKVTSHAARGIGENNIELSKSVLESMSKPIMELWQKGTDQKGALRRSFS